MWSSVNRVFRDIDTVIVQQQYAVSPVKFMMLCEIVWKNTETHPETVLDEINTELDLFDEIIIISSEGKRTLCFLAGEYGQNYKDLFLFTTREFLCFIELPLTITREYGVVNLVGPPEDVDRLINFLNDWGSDMEVVAVSDYNSQDRGVLSALTERQKQILKHAYDHGFFDHPRKMSARKLSAMLGMKHTTYLTHIRKAQKRLLSTLYA